MLTAVAATCFIVPSSLITNLSASAIVIAEAEVPPSSILSSAGVAVIAVSLSAANTGNVPD